MMCYTQENDTVGEVVSKWHELMKQSGTSVAAESIDFFLPTSSCISGGVNQSTPLSPAREFYSRTRHRGW